jgi:hypothetical protein
MTSNQKSWILKQQGVTIWKKGVAEINKSTNAAMDKAETTLDDAVRQSFLQADAQPENKHLPVIVDYVKIDVQGAELFMLQSAQHILETASFVQV